MIGVMLYRLQTDVATFELKREPLGMWDLWIDGTPTLTYATPEEGAEAVAQHESGYSVWDNSEMSVSPDLSTWEQIEES